MAQLIDHCRKHRRALGQAPMRQSWIAKANVPDEPDHQWLIDIADAQEPAVRLAFLAALKKIKDTIQEAALLDAVTRGDVLAVLRALGLERAAPDALQQMIVPLENAFINSGRATPPTTLGASIGMRFDLTNPNTATFLRNYNFELVRQISDDTREGIRRVISDAFAWGGHPSEQARLIRESIGLTDTQAKAVDNFRSLLVNRDRDAMTRALRDRRFDPTLDRALGDAADRELTDEQIDRMVERYRQRYINFRATTIARTETMRASNAAMNMAWGQAADKGLLSRQTTRRFWLVTPDDRLCEFCEAIPEMNPNGVPLDGFFDSDFGPIAYPPLHPACRCVTYIDQGNSR